MADVGAIYQVSAAMEASQPSGVCTRDTNLFRSLFLAPIPGNVVVALYLYMGPFFFPEKIYGTSSWMGMYSTVLGRLWRVPSSLPIEHESQLSS